MGFSTLMYDSWQLVPALSKRPRIVQVDSHSLSTRATAMRRRQPSGMSGMQRGSGGVGGGAAAYIALLSRSLQAFACASHATLVMAADLHSPPSQNCNRVNTVLLLSSLTDSNELTKFRLVTTNPNFKMLCTHYFIIHC